MPTKLEAGLGRILQQTPRGICSEVCVMEEGEVIASAQKWARGFDASDLDQLVAVHALSLQQDPATITNITSSDRQSRGLLTGFPAAYPTTIGRFSAAGLLHHDPTALEIMLRMSGGPTQARQTIAEHSLLRHYIDPSHLKPLGSEIDNEKNLRRGMTAEEAASLFTEVVEDKRWGRPLYHNGFVYGLRRTIDPAIAEHRWLDWGPDPELVRLAAKRQGNAAAYEELLSWRAPRTEFPNFVLPGLPDEFGEIGLINGATVAILHRRSVSAPEINRQALCGVHSQIGELLLRR